VVHIGHPGATHSKDQLFSRDVDCARFFLKQAHFGEIAHFGRSIELIAISFTVISNDVF